MDLIRSFVAVGRRMSITHAADDLYVTQSAVSRQIHALEEMLRAKLLVRGHRSIAFTPEGERLFEVADAAVRKLQEVVDSISVARDRRPVTVSTPVGFAGLWLVPRMARFQQEHPEIDVRISVNSRLVDLRNEGIDLAIRYCLPSAAPRGAVRLFGETLAPVAHPSVRSKPLEHADDISSYFLLEFDDPRRSYLQWPAWLSAMGWGTTKAKGILRFNQYDQVIQAAVAGQGIALGRIELLGTMLEERQLVPLCQPRAIEQAYAHWIIHGEAEPREDVADVMNWIVARAAQMEFPR